MSSPRKPTAPSGDPRHGSDRTFQKALAELGSISGHPELATVPWALWGHSGGGLWAGAMTLLHPERVAAAWLRSGVPSMQLSEGKPAPFAVSDSALQVPVMCNLGTKEGVSVEEGQFAKVWPNVRAFFLDLRGKGGLAAVAVDPISSHDCGNQRYLAIPWLDACLTARLPNQDGGKLRSMPAETVWLAELKAGTGDNAPPVPVNQFRGELKNSIWLPNASVASAWLQYVTDTAVADVTPPSAPHHVRISGRQLTWECSADLESGLARFVIERDGQVLATIPELAKNPFGRPIFQYLSYSDTPTQPLAQMRFTDTTVHPGQHHRYRIAAVNTVGLQSEFSPETP